MAVSRELAYEASIGRTGKQQSTRNLPILLTATGSFHELVVFHSPLESPGKEEHVHLEQGKRQGADKDQSGPRAARLA